AKKDLDKALAAAQAARRLKATPESAELVRQVEAAKALAAAEKKGAEAKREAERRLAEEKKKREAADALAKRNQDAYLDALKRAQKALGEKRYDEAVASYQAALKLFRTDAALTELKQAEELRDREKARLAAEKAKRDEEANRAAKLKGLLAEAQKALDAKQFDKARGLYREATKLAPGNAEALAGLSRAERERDAWAARNREAAEAARRQAEVKRLVGLGKAKLKAKDYEGAVTALREAAKLDPKDADAQ